MTHLQDICEDTAPATQARRPFNMVMPGSLPTGLQAASVQAAPEAHREKVRTCIRNPEQYWPWPLDELARNQCLPKVQELKVKTRASKEAAAAVLLEPAALPVQMALFDIPAPQAARTSRRSSDARP